MLPTFCFVFSETCGGWPAYLGLNFCVSGAHWVVMLYCRSYKLFLVLLWVREACLFEQIFVSIKNSKKLWASSNVSVIETASQFLIIILLWHLPLCEEWENNNIFVHNNNNNNEKVEFLVNILLIFYKAVEMGLLQLLSLPDQDSSCPGRFWWGCKHCTQQPSWADAPLQSVRDVPVLPSLTESCLSGSKDR